MPSIKAAARALGTTLGLAALLAAPAQAKNLTPGVCTPAGTLSHAFAPFGDDGLYTAVANAGLEQGTTSWTLSGGAAVADGNEPWFIGGDASESHSLALPEDATATTAPFCVDETFTHFRAFARAAGKGTLRVEVLYTDGNGREVSDKVADFKATSAWAPTGRFPINVIKRAGTTTLPVSFRFTARNTDFQLDDVYVDPWARS
jgi:hypothetical protein